MTESTMKPKEAKGGTFSPADIPLIKKALYAYLNDLDPMDDDVSKAAALLHRLGRIS